MFILIYYLIIAEIGSLQLNNIGVNGFNFCSKNKNLPDLCGHIKDENGLTKEHIACEPGVLKRKGELSYSYPMTEKLKNHILHLHNVYRNDIASGTTVAGSLESKFPIALRMRELIWDDELAYLAHVQALRCNDQLIDICRATRRFLYPGETKASKMTNTEITAIDFITEVLKSYQSQKSEITDPRIQMHLHSVSNDVAKDFLTMIMDRISRVGCAISVCRNCYPESGDRTNLCYFFICNYDYSPQIDSYIYLNSSVAGIGCNEWKTEPSKTYPNLCTGNGLIFFDSYGKEGN